MGYRRLLVPLVLALLSLLRVPLVAAQGVAVETIEAIDAMYSQAVESDTVPGISVAVGTAEGMEFVRGYGYADLENRVAMSSAHKLRIGSVSKLIATAGLMRLYDAGKVDLDVPVRRYAAAWPRFHAPLTLRQLTSHSAGVRHYKQGAGEFLLNESFPDIGSALALFSGDPLLFAPGDRQSYSTFAWTLVSAAMEGADGARDFRQIIEEEVITPLSLDETAFDDQYPLIPRRARLYTVVNEALQNAPQTDHSYKWAGGGFIASTADVVRFAIAHVSGDYLEADTVAQMFTPAKLNSGERADFGIGWMVGFDRYRNREQYRIDPELQALMDAVPDAVMHSGGSNGGTTMLILSPAHRRAVAVVKNVDGDDSVDVFRLALETLARFNRADK